MTRAAAFFDLDKTVIATTSAMAFSREFYAGGLVTRAEGLRSAYAHFVFMLGSADADQTERLRASMSTLVTGWDVAQVREIVTSSLATTIDPVVYAEAVDLIREHHAAGRDVVIVSASASDLVAPIAAVLGADDFIASQMEVADGRYTGNITFYAYGEHKAEAIRDLAAREGYDLAASYAYSDSVTDVPMLSVVGHATAVNPDRALRAAADERGWEVRRFARPVSARTALTSKPVLATAGAVTLAGVVALVWGVARRRRA
ncbi:HAD family hydrolase [Luteimicrobium subarcticum]|uniref:HAD superfamily hydrolase (TIGR01490 family) n=1 Tax=Luteimicrobium subarcticum TaxID=620910 RepID=A0A2M8WSG3_9MICO|nr:HAD family hydrolase [Luteimicrobium subarcticum]PJI93869.1 HAD superfamily hydrolase (TIGR01490 family) [Luteimicrobium subarcticum]